MADRVLAPFITVNGSIHTPTSSFLRHHGTIRRDPVLAATEDQFAA